MESKMLFLLALSASVALYGYAGDEETGWRQILVDVVEMGKVINQFISPKGKLETEAGCEGTDIKGVFMTKSGNPATFGKTNEEMADVYQYMVMTSCHKVSGVANANSSMSFFTFLGPKGLEKVNNSMVVDNSWDDNITPDKTYSEANFIFYKNAEALGDDQRGFYEYYETWKLSSSFGLKGSMSFVVSAVASTMALLHFTH